MFSLRQIDEAPATNKGAAIMWRECNPFRRIIRFAWDNPIFTLFVSAI
jgi:hypothetical protein